MAAAPLPVRTSPSSAKCPVATKFFCTCLLNFPHLSFSLHSHLQAQDRALISCLTLALPSLIHHSYCSHSEHKITLLKTLWQFPIAFTKIQSFSMVCETQQDLAPACTFLASASFRHPELLPTKLFAIPIMPCSFSQMWFCQCILISWSTSSPHLVNPYSVSKILLRCASCIKLFQNLMPLSWVSLSSFIVDLASWVTTHHCNCNSLSPVRTGGSSRPHRVEPEPSTMT